jgi:hypothetical protein
MGLLLACSLRLAVGLMVLTLVPSISFWIMQLRLLIRLTLLASCIYNQTFISL